MGTRIRNKIPERATGIRLETCVGFRWKGENKSAFSTSKAMICVCGSSDAGLIITYQYIDDVEVMSCAIDRGF